MQSDGVPTKVILSTQFRNVLIWFGENGAIGRQF